MLIENLRVEDQGVEDLEVEDLKVVRGQKVIKVVLEKILAGYVSFAKIIQVRLTKVSILMNCMQKSLFYLIFKISNHSEIVKSSQG